MRWLLRLWRRLRPRFVVGTGGARYVICENGRCRKPHLLVDGRFAEPRGGALPEVVRLHGWGL